MTSGSRLIASAGITTSSNETDSHQQQGAHAPSSNRSGSTPQSQGAAHPAAISPDQDLEQPTAAEAAREEEQYGLNTPAPGKGDSSSGSSSNNNSGSSRNDGESA
ncbi:hypothetical protein OEZ85_011630 [Tetradesmus obliquus]|uniref:Uncharacterized protein n=1 Tax=Tetradesmus obliquus TaxID=3088 RepID=A0ABY8TR88_TETOB|nr:hypothetical protein OEZ85_011630 [Tetradesmus obliquus]